MRVVVEGNVMRLWINGESQGELSDTTNAGYAAGKAGVWGWQTGASFDDFTVSGDAVESLTPVEPQDKLATTWGRIKQQF